MFSAFSSIYKWVSGGEAGGNPHYARGLKLYEQSDDKCLDALLKATTVNLDEKVQIAQSVTSPEKKSKPHKKNPDSLSIDQAASGTLAHTKKEAVKELNTLQRTLKKQAGNLDSYHNEAIKAKGTLEEMKDNATLMLVKNLVENIANLKKEITHLLNTIATTVATINNPDEKEIANIKTSCQSTATICKEAGFAKKISLVENEVQNLKATVLNKQREQVQLQQLEQQEQQRKLQEERDKVKAVLEKAKKEKEEKAKEDRRKANKIKRKQEKAETAAREEAERQAAIEKERAENAEKEKLAKEKAEKEKAKKEEAERQAALKKQAEKIKAEQEAKQKALNIKEAKKTNILTDIISKDKLEKLSTIDLSELKTNLLTSGSSNIKIGLACLAIESGDVEFLADVNNLQVHDTDTFIYSTMTKLQEKMSPKKIEHYLPIEFKLDLDKNYYAHYTGQDSLSGVELTVLYPLTITSSPKPEHFKLPNVDLIPFSTIKGRFRHKKNRTQNPSHVISIKFNDDYDYIIEDPQNILKTMFATRQWHANLIDPLADYHTDIFERAFHNHFRLRPIHILPDEDAHKIVESKGEYAHYFFGKRYFAKCKRPSEIENNRHGCFIEILQLIKRGYFNKKELDSTIKAFLNIVILNGLSRDAEITALIEKCGDYQHNVSLGDELYQFCTTKKPLIDQQSTNMLIILREFLVDHPGRHDLFKLAVECLLTDPQTTLTKPMSEYLKNSWLYTIGNYVHSVTDHSFFSALTYDDQSPKSLEHCLQKNPCVAPAEHKLTAPLPYLGVFAAPVSKKSFRGLSPISTLPTFYEKQMSRSKSSFGD